MKIKDTYQDRLFMAEMHDDVLQRLDDAIVGKRSIEACWLCYSCFESRITRTLEKVSVCCSERKCYQNHKVGIKTKIECLKRLKKLSYAGTENFNRKFQQSTFRTNYSVVQGAEHFGSRLGDIK